MLRDYTEGKVLKLDDATFVAQLVQDTDKLNLIALNSIKPTKLQLSSTALLLRI